MNFRVSHVFKEGNSVADVLANNTVLINHDGADVLPQFLVSSFGHGLSSRFSYRFF